MASAVRIEEVQRRRRFNLSRSTPCYLASSLPLLEAASWTSEIDFVIVEHTTISTDSSELSDLDLPPFVTDNSNPEDGESENTEVDDTVERSEEGILFSECEAAAIKELEEHTTPEDIALLLRALDAVFNKARNWLNRRENAHQERFRERDRFWRSILQPATFRRRSELRCTANW